MKEFYDLVESLVGLLSKNVFACLVASVWAAGFVFCACGAVARAARLRRFKNRKKESESKEEGELNEW